MVGQFDADADGKVQREEVINGPTLAFLIAPIRIRTTCYDAKELAAAKAVETRAKWRSPNAVTTTREPEGLNINHRNDILAGS